MNFEERVIKLSKIRIFGLGGLNENGKNCYIVEVDDNIFIFDCGIKYASSNLFGIDYIMPDFSYLEKNKSKIRGIFITHGHGENMGATKDLISMLPNIKIYATKFTKYILELLNLDNNLIYEEEITKAYNKRLEYFEKEDARFVMGEHG